ncbi:unnamed protein product [Closterium sp. NIES-64]|nr:unnamed protein product [Closterium sp. NIES-64]CAI6000945.1 unnamed protein product [Closterium sp. NIES-65]
MAAACVFLALVASLTIVSAQAPTTPTVLVPQTAEGMSKVLFPNFNDITMVTLFGSAQQNKAAGTIRLTSQPHSAGGVILRTPLLLLDKKFANSTTCKPLAWRSVFQFKSSGKADGLAFVIWSKLRNLGSPDGYLGYGGPAVRYKKSRSMAVELDMAKNTWDPSATHVGINTRGSMKSLAWRVLRAPLNDAIPRRVWIEYDGQSLSVSVGKGSRKPKAPLLRYAINTCNALKQPGYYVGITASNAGGESTNEILAWSFSASPSTSLCPMCGSVMNPKKKVSCCMPFQCCNGVCLAPTELCAGTTCCGSPDSGRVCWGVKCCSVTSLCMTKKKQPVCCPQIGNSTCCV